MGTGSISEGSISIFLCEDMFIKGKNGQICGVFAGGACSLILSLSDTILVKKAAIGG